MSNANVVCTSASVFAAFGFDFGGAPIAVTAAVRAYLLLVLIGCGGAEASPADAAGGDVSDVVVRDCAEPLFDAGDSSPAWASGEFHMRSDYVADSTNMRVGGKRFQWEMSGCDFAPTAEGLVVESDGGVTLVGIDGSTFYWPGYAVVAPVPSVTLISLPEGGFEALSGDASTLWAPGTMCGCGPAFHACGCEDPFELLDHDW